MEIEINGLKYRRKEQNNPSTTRASRMSTMLMGFAMMAQGSVGTSKPPKERPKVNIVEEFKLIQQKKSKLSRSERNWVVSQFNRNFELI